MPKELNKSLKKGEKFYKMRLEGLSNKEVAERCGETVQTCAARTSNYRLHFNLPRIAVTMKENAKEKEKVKTRVNGLVQYERNLEEIRAENHAQATRDERGVLICPTKHLNGYGWRY